MIKHHEVTTNSRKAEKPMTSNAFLHSVTQPSGAVRQSTEHPANFIWPDSMTVRDKRKQPL